MWLAKVAGTVDDLSGGRLQLGIGAGWQQREHEHFGFDLLPIPQRLERFREGTEVITSLLRSAEPVTFQGHFYHLHEAMLYPRPQRPGGPPLIIGGGRSILPLAARYADEWNTAFAPVDKIVALSQRLDELLQREGRPAQSVRRSLMTRVIFGRNEQELQQKIAASGRSFAALRAAGLLVGTSAQIVEQLGQLAEVGVQRVMLQWLDLDDLDGIAALAQGLLPQLK